MSQLDGLSHRSSSRRKYATALAGLALFSLGFASLIDESLHSFLADRAPSLTWIPHARVSSLLASIVLYAVVRRWTARAVPVAAPRWRPALLLAVGWICIATLFVLLTRDPGRVAEPHDLGDYVSLLFTGLWEEELIFRGMIFNLAGAALPDSKLKSLWIVCFSAVLAALAHLQYHSFHLTREALLQVLLTLPGCFIYALLRSYSANFWLSGLVHSVNNIISVVFYFR